MANIPNRDTSSCAQLVAALQATTMEELSAEVEALQRRFKRFKIPFVISLGYGADQNTPQSVVGIYTLGSVAGMGAMPVFVGGRDDTGSITAVPIARAGQVPPTQSAFDIYVPTGGGSFVLFDQTSPVNTAQDSGSLDTRGFREVMAWAIASAGTTTLLFSPQDDASASFVNGAATAAALVTSIAVAPGAVAGGLVIQAQPMPVPRHSRFLASTAGVGNTVRLYVLGRR